jgi:hypothetical protein
MVRMPGHWGGTAEGSDIEFVDQHGFDVNVGGTMSKTQLEGAINGGGPVLDLSTTNGRIRVQRLSIGSGAETFAKRSQAGC